MNGSSLVSPGQGVPRSTPPEEAPPDPEKKGTEEDAEPEVEKDVHGRTIWHPVAFFKDQLFMKPDMCKVGAPIAKVFDLVKPDDLKSYNDLLSKTVPVGAPQIIIDGEDKQFHNGSFIVFLKYTQVQYKHLVKPPTS